MNKSITKEILPLGLILLSTILIIITLCNGSKYLPSHWNISGEIDSYDDSASVLILLISSIIIYAFMTFFQRNPQYCNYPRPFKDFNKAHKIMAHFAYVTKTITIALFTYFTICSILCETLNIFIVLSIIIADIIAMIFYISKLSKA